MTTARFRLLSTVALPAAAAVAAGIMLALAWLTTRSVAAHHDLALDGRVLGLAHRAERELREAGLARAGGFLGELLSESGAEVRGLRLLDSTGDEIAAAGSASRRLPVRQLELFLERQRRSREGENSLAGDTSLGENLVAILDKANELVPSDAGSLLLDDPTIKAGDRGANELTIIAVFGEKADLLIGHKIKSSEGIAGRVYLTGETHQAGDAQKDRFFHSAIDEATEFQTQALVAIPIRSE